MASNCAPEPQVSGFTRTREPVRPSNQYELRGVRVEFPFEAYDCQRVYMARVIEALQQGTNALLESPTGTGKTLCLLCSVLAWRQNFIAHQQLHALPDSEAKKELEATFQEPELNLPSSEKRLLSDFGRFTREKASLSSALDAPATSKPVIVYSSRTHSQIQQVVKELKSTRYKPRIAILGSRAQMCVHPRVSAESGHRQNQACKVLVAKRECGYYNGLDAFSANNSTLDSEVMDIEDLVKVGREHTMCPYYYSQKNAADADLVFMPYNYLVDPKIRRTLDVNLNNAIIIFDEAHNLEDVCSNASSFDLTAADVAGAVSEVTNCMQIIKSPKVGIEIPDTLEEESLLRLKEILLEFETVLDDLEPNKTHPGSFVTEIFGRVSIDVDRFPILAQMIKAVDDFLGSDSAEMAGLGITKTSSLKTFGDALKVAFREDDGESASKFYRVHIHEPTPQKKTKSFFASASAGKTIGYWCFNPGFAIQQLCRLGVRSLILTSGTLSPLDSFAAEFQIGFPVRLENPHVIQPSQVLVSVLSAGPTGEKLDASYKNRSNVKYQQDLGNTLANLARMVPDGLLVFFSSYRVMGDLCKFWKTSHDGRMSIWERISNCKEIIVEGRSQKDFQEGSLRFSELISSRRGACLMAVTRGKISEGLDFADRSGRAVVVVGMPFPSVVDPRVRLKREYLDLQRAQEGLRIPGHLPLRPSVVRPTGRPSGEPGHRTGHTAPAGLRSDYSGRPTIFPRFANIDLCVAPAAHAPPVAVRPAEPRPAAILQARRCRLRSIRQSGRGGASAIYPTGGRRRHLRHRPDCPAAHHR
eukprot:727513_1